MRFVDWLDTLPVVGIFVVFAIVASIAYELGYRLGRWWQARTPEEVGGPTSMIVGSLLGLMAFLLAISMGSVFFGACTYIGNGPNFMVKSIADHAGALTPSFFGYIVWFTLPVLLPILVLCWALFLR